MSPPLAALRRVPFGAQILLALVLGVVLGLTARTYDLSWLSSTLETVGSTFVTLLRLAVPPLVFTAIVVSVANLRRLERAAQLLVQTLLWFMVTSLIAVTVGIGIGLLVRPGEGLVLDLAGAEAPETVGGWTDFLTGLVPTNVMGAFGPDGEVLQVVVLALVVGAAAVAVGEPAEPFLRLTRSVLDIVQKALWWVIRLAPIGTLGLLGHAVDAYGWDALAPLARFTGSVYAGLALVLLVVYPLLLVLAGRLDPRRFFAGAWPAMQLAFVSRSSIGTMPLTQRVTVDRLGVPADYASFAVPFGATTKMDGCAAIYPALAAIFVAQVFGVSLGPAEYVLIAFVSVIGSAATAGLTGALVMLTLTLSTLGLPLAGAGLLLAIDPILDMGRTAVNVTGQALVPVLVAARQGLLDRGVYDGPKRRLDVRADAAAQPEPLAEARELAGSRL